MNTSQTRESIEAARESMVKFFQGFLVATCLVLQVCQPAILLMWELYSIREVCYEQKPRSKNPQKRYYQQIFQLPKPSLLREIILEKGKIIPNKEDLVVDKEKKISSLKLGGDKILPQKGRRGFCEPNLISRKDSSLGKVSNSNYSYSILPLHTFF